MSTHGQSAQARWAYGSVTERVVHGATCAVLVAPVTTSSQSLARINHRKIRENPSHPFNPCIYSEFSDRLLRRRQITNTLVPEVYLGAQVILVILDDDGVSTVQSHVSLVGPVGATEVPVI